MYRVEARSVPGGIEADLLRGAQPLRFDAFFELLEGDRDFGLWLSDFLLGVGFRAAYWEFPQLSRQRLSGHCRFVLLDAPPLLAAKSSELAFAEHFVAVDQHGAVCFPSLGGDAVLVAPTPRRPLLPYGHLLSFLAHAPREQILALWQLLAEQMIAALEQGPRWLSTSGLGVPWLHIRIDHRPKYYQHRAYLAPQPRADTT